MSPKKSSARDTRKLLDSKWTAKEPDDRERHFVVRRVFEDQSSAPSAIRVELEAVLSRRRRELALSELRDPNLWAHGWLS